MSDPADKNFDNPADNPYAPKSVRPVNPRGGLGAPESAFPRFLRSVNKQGGTGAENEIAANDAKLWRKSLNPEIMSSSPPSFPSSSFTSWNPWWPITIVCAVVLGTAIGMYIVDGATW